MKKMRSVFGGALCALLLLALLLFPAEMSGAAAGAALIWWTRVLPTLLPYLIVAALLLQSGALLRVPKKLLPLAMFLCGALCGYPVGAQLARTLYDAHALSREDAARVAMRCNLPNPVFLLSVVSLGFFGDARCAAPLLIGVYGIALLFALPLYRMSIRTVSLVDAPDAGGLSEAIAGGVRTVGVIGGCIVFASVLGALLQTVFSIRHPAVLAFLLGCFEMTAGVRAAAALPASLPFRLALAAAFVQFGGLSVLLQTVSQFPVGLLRCAGSKLLYAVLSAVLTYFLTPLFVPYTPVPTFAATQQMRQNAVSLLSVTLAATVGLLFVFLFTVRFRPKSGK